MVAASGHGDQQTDEAEQIAERDQGKHHPDRMQADLGADELRRQHVAFERLADQEHAITIAMGVQFGQNCAIATTAATRKPVSQPDVGDEAQQPRHQPDQETEIEAGQRQPDRVEHREDQADYGLAAHEARDGVVDIAGEAVHRGAMLQRNPAIHCLGDGVPSRSSR